MSNPTPTSKQYECDICSKHFTRQSHYEAHMRIHSGERPFQCDFEGCDKTFRRKDHLQRHMCSHNGVRKHKCDFENCNQAFITAAHLHRHKATHENRPYVCTCDVCGEGFHKKTQLRSHRLEAHGIVAFKCDIADCGKCFPSQSKLDRHMLAHASRSRRHYVCDIPHCSLVFPNLEALRRHSLSHADVIDSHISRKRRRSIDKDGDGEDTADKEESNISSDKPSSSGEKFFCIVDGCGRSFAQRHNLLAHMSAVHSDVKRFECPIPYCKRQFGFKTSLDRHIMKVHGGAKEGSKTPIDVQKLMWRELLGAESVPV